MTSDNYLAQMKRLERLDECPRSRSNGAAALPDALSAFDALPANEMPLLDPDDERAEIDRLLGIVYEEILENQPVTEQEAA